jgi:hypothetical protein
MNISQKKYKKLDVFSFKRECLIQDGKLKIAYGGYAITAVGKKYLSLKSLDQCNALEKSFSWAKLTGRNVCIDGTEIGGVIFLKGGFYFPNKKLTTARVMATMEMRRNELKSESEKIATGKHRSFDRVDEKINFRLNGVSSKLGIKSLETVDITRAAFEKLNLHPEHYFAIMKLDAEKKKKFMLMGNQQRANFIKKLMK